MLRISLFKTKNPRRFDYLPRYHDPRKEEMDERYKNAETELGVGDGKPRREIKFRRTGYTYGEEHKRARKRSLIRLLVIVIALCLLFWQIFERLDLMTEILDK